MGTITTATSAAEVLLSYPTAINVFERLGIPLGLVDRSILSVAVERGINPQLLLALLYVTLNHRPYNLERLQWEDGGPLIDYLLASHAYYGQVANPRIVSLITAMRAQENGREMGMVESFFRKYVAEVDQHFCYERDVAFPYMQRVFGGERPPTREYSVSVYKQRHDNIEEKLYDLKSLLVKYLPTNGIYSARKELYLRVHELADDLNAHACIEDQILIPLVEREEKGWKA